MLYNLSRLMGVSALKTVYRIIEKSLKIDEKPSKTRIYALCFLSISQKLKLIEKNLDDFFFKFINIFVA